jgi:hypothetical protein
MNALFAWIFKLIFAAAALIFAASLLLALWVVLVVTSLWSLLHGRKPQVAVLWTRYRDITQGMQQVMRRGGPWSAARRPSTPERGAAAEADIVDVQVKEVHEPPRRLPHQD